MNDIIEPTMDYDFEKLYFGPPTTLAGGAYFARIMYDKNKPLFIQTPKSLTKQGFIKSGKKIYTDLMFDNNDTVFINWIENLEARCQSLVFSKRESWFETKLEKDDIESAFTSPFKIFKSGKYYLLRVNVKQNIKIYGQHGDIVSCDDIADDKNIISILEIQGLKFTSRNFQIEIELKQSMVVSPDPFLDECFIKNPVKKHLIKDETFNNNSGINKNNTNTNESIDLDKIVIQSVIDLEKKEEKKEEKNTESPIDLDISFETDEETNKINNDNILGLEEADIIVDVEDVDNLKNMDDKNEEEDPNVLKEVDLSSTLGDDLETFSLKKPNQVYYEIYQKAREKAKEAKKNAILAYLEMKNIKKTYMLDNIDESDSEFEEFASSSEISETESLEDTE
jgi:hypothetical protein